MINFKNILFLLSFSFAASGINAQEFDAEVINQSNRYEVSKEKLVVIDSICIQINNRLGDRFAEIEIPYSKDEKLSNLDAWIEDLNGFKVRSIKKSEIIEKNAISNISFYEDHFVKTFVLKHNVYPYRVGYTYKTTTRNYIEIAQWTPVIFKTIPNRSANLTVVSPRDFKLSVYSNLVTEHKADSNATTITHEWKANYEKPIKHEIFSKTDLVYPFVIVTPLNFNYGVEGCLKDWASYGNWQYRLIEGLDDLPEAEKTTITTLIKGQTNKREIVKILYHYLQDHTRYINVAIGIGGMKPYPASFVATNKYGDCKGLSNYMKAMLKYAGIESIYANIYAGDQPNELIKTQPGPQFNHIVLAVPLEKDTIWLENTSNTNPFAYMGSFTQNREALLIKKDDSRFVHVPSLSSEDNTSTYKIDFSFGENGNAKAKLKTLFKGSEYELFNAINTEYNKEEKDQLVKEYMPFDNYETENWELKKEDRDSASIYLNAEIKLSKLLKPLADERYFNLYPCHIPRFTVPENRQLPLELPYPISNRYELIYHIPTGLEVKNLPNPISIHTDYGEYSAKFDIENGNLKISKGMLIKSGSYPLSEYPKFYQFIKTIKDKDGTIFYSPKSNHRNCFYS